MRVVLLNQYYSPDEAATAQLLGDLGAGLAAAGHDVTAICGRRGYTDPSRTYPKRETIRGVKVERTFASGFGRGSKIGRSLDYLTFMAGAALRLLFRKKPDVVISLSTPPMVALLGLILARLRGARSIYWVMDVYPDLAYELGVLKPGSFAARLLDWISRAVLRGSDTVIALDALMARKLEEVRGSEVLVVANWADGDAIRPKDTASNPLREEWGWNGRFVVLYSGNLGLAHEFETVLDAAERLKDDTGILFAFVGGGPRLDAVKSAVKDRELQNVEFRPYVARERLGDSLTAGDLHLVTLRERMPGLLVPCKIYGILAAGKPPVYVGPSEGEVADIVERGCGVPVPLGGGAELAAAVSAYRDDPERVRREGDAARALYESDYSIQRALNQFDRLLA
ncbi:hypothetical protein ABI59_04895 [Acidobacteria bacterium Mor1]|nr:hypothetical protein ABI59_04895 [Acidobacteria bacterium Mor1]